jgi:hypothetical protein
VDCSGETSLSMRAIVEQGAHIKKFGFLEEKLSDGLEKNASKRAKCQVCICR